MLKLNVVYTFVLALSATSLVGQDAPTLRQGNLEVGGFVGGGYGLGVANSLRTEGYTITGDTFHLMGGGDVGYAITKSIFLVGEASYFPSLGAVDLNQTSGTLETDHVYTRRITEFNAGVHYRLPVPEKRWVPYLVGGVGGVRGSGSAVTATVTDLSKTPPTTSTPVMQPAPASQTVFAINGGAGLRFYVTEHFGFRGEFRLFKPIGVENLTSFYRVAGGIFFQLK